jgi:cold shock CspA family protein
MGLCLRRPDNLHVVQTREFCENSLEAVLEKTPDIFVHMETVRRCGFTELRPSQMVLVRYGSGPHGLMAADIKPDEISRPSLIDAH